MRWYGILPFSCLLWQCLFAQTPCTISTIAGPPTLFAGDGGPATAAYFSDIDHFVFDSAGQIYLSDIGNHRVRKIDVHGVITTVVGNGTSGSGGDGGPATSAQLQVPEGLALDSAGNLFIADAYANRIRKVSPNGIITTVAGNGTAGFGGDGGPALAASLNQPIAVGVDANGNIYIADSSNLRIRKVSSGGTISTIAGVGSVNSLNNSEGSPGTSWAFSSLSDLVVSPSGFVYIGDYAAQRVVVLSPTGLASTYAGGKLGQDSGDGGPATQAAVTPRALALDSSGNLAIASASEVRQVSVSGIISAIDAQHTSLHLAFNAASVLYGSSSTTIYQIGTNTITAGGNQFNNTGDGGPATAARFFSIQSLASDAAGNLYVLDKYDYTVRKISPNGTISHLASLNTYASALAVDAAGNVFVAGDFDQTVYKISAGGATSVFYRGGGSFTFINSMTVAPNGDVYVSTDHGVFRISIGAVTPSVYSSGSGPLAADKSGNVFYVAGNTLQELSGTFSAVLPAGGDQVAGLAADAAGNVFISRGTDIVKVTPGGLASIFVKFDQFYNNAPPTAAGAGYAGAITTDPAGDLLVADTLANSIRQVPVGCGATTVITFPAIGPQLVGNSLTLMATASSNAAVTYSVSGPATINGNQIVFMGAGQVAVTANAGNASTTQSITVGPAAQTIQVQPIGPHMVGDAPFPIVATGGASGNSVYFAVQSGPATINGNLVTVNAPGTVVIVANQSGSTNYTAAVPAIVSFPVTAGTCSASLSSSSFAAQAMGDLITFLATPAGANCSISPVSNAPWLTIQSSGTGSVMVTVLVAANPNGVARVGTISVSGQTFTVTQAANCQFTLSPTSLQPAAGSTVSVNVTANSPTCGGTVNSLSPYFTLTSSAMFTGSTVVTFTLDRNAAPYARDVAASIGGVRYDFMQSGIILVVGPGALVNAASYTQAVAPGSIASVFGTLPIASPYQATSLPLDVAAQDVFFIFQGDPTPTLPVSFARVFYANATQANIQVPWETATMVNPTIAASSGNSAIPSHPAQIATYAPGIFTMNGQGTGQGAIVDSFYRVTDTLHPATANDYIVIFCTGLGPVTNQPLTGSAAPSSPYSETTTLPKVTIGGASATVIFSGLAPGFVGLNQINVQVPAGAAKGSAVPVSVSIGGVQSNTVTIAVQ